MTDKGGDNERSLSLRENVKHFRGSPLSLTTTAADHFAALVMTGKGKRLRIASHSFAMTDKGGDDEKSLSLRENVKHFRGSPLSLTTTAADHFAALVMTGKGKRLRIASHSFAMTDKGDDNEKSLSLRENVKHFRGSPVSLTTTAADHFAALVMTGKGKRLRIASHSFAMTDKCDDYEKSLSLRENVKHFRGSPVSLTTTAADHFAALVMTGKGKQLRIASHSFAMTDKCDDNEKSLLLRENVKHFRGSPVSLSFYAA